MNSNNMKARILSTNIEAKLSIKFIRNFDDNTVDCTEFSEGDAATIQWVDPKNYKTLSEHGVIKTIRSTSHFNNIENVTIIFDASEKGCARKLVIPMLNIVSITLDEDPEAIAREENAILVEPNRTGALPSQSPITWSLRDVKVKDNLLEIPYARLAAGTVELTISDNHNSGKVLFKERFVTDAPNAKASFTWSLRDFSAVAAAITDESLLVEDGFYIYRNGDSDNDIIAATDNDNDLIVPVGTQLFIQITFKDTVEDDIDAPEITISKVYTVTSEDIVAVTSDTE